MSGMLRSVNVGRPTTFEFRGQTATSAIWKTPVEGRVAARGVNLDGDGQADRTVHGGTDKAVYAYAIEDYRWWEGEVGRSLGPGTFGENLTTEEVDLSRMAVGTRCRVGTVVLEASDPRLPCWKLGVRMDDPAFVKAFTQAARPGSYFRIVEEGELGAGDPIEVVFTPDHDLTVGHIFRIFTRDRHEAARLLDVPAVSASWRAWAEERVRRR